MSRLIDTNKLIHALANDYVSGKKTLGQIIDDQPTVEFPRWIPCNERLPECDGWYLSSGTVCFGNSVHIFYFNTSNKKWVSTDFDNCETFAWMPLPTPYHIESSDK